MPQDGILIVSGSEKARLQLKAFLPPETGTRIVLCATGNEARRSLNTERFDLLMINAPLPDESGLELALESAGAPGRGVLLLISANFADAVEEKLLSGGVAVVTKPINRDVLYQSMKLIEMMQSKVRQIQRENEKLCAKLDEAKLVGKAKCLLIEHKGLTEDDAHRYLEKYAMNNRLTKREAARSIIEDLSAL